MFGEASYQATQKSLWYAVKTARDQNVPFPPDNMSVNGVKVNNHDLPTEFAKFFNDKIAQINYPTEISNTVYKGSQKIEQPNSFFMTDADIL